METLSFSMYKTEEFEFLLTHQCTWLYNHSSFHFELQNVKRYYESRQCLLKNVIHYIIINDYSRDTF